MARMTAFSSAVSDCDINVTSGEEVWSPPAAEVGGSILFILLLAIFVWGAMGAFTDLFGYIPKVKVLEAFAENPDDALSAPEVERMTDVSRRAAYLIIKHYVDSGVITPAGNKGQTPRRFRLNPNDLRSRTVQEMERLITLGSIQSEIKARLKVPQEEPLPLGVVSQLPTILVAIGWRTVTPSSMILESRSIELDEGVSLPQSSHARFSSQSAVPYTIQYPEVIGA